MGKNTTRCVYLKTTVNLQATMRHPLLASRQSMCALCAASEVEWMTAWLSAHSYEDFGVTVQHFTAQCFPSKQQLKLCREEVTS